MEKHDKPVVTKLKRLIMPVCLFAFCVALYILTKPGANEDAAFEAQLARTTGSNGEAEAVSGGEAAPVEQAETDYPPSHDFMERVMEQGVDGELTEDYSGVEERRYTLKHENGSTATLVLSQVNGAVYAATLKTERPIERIDGSLIRAELEAGSMYDERVNWISAIASGLIHALNEDVKFADSEALLFELRAAIADGGERHSTLGGISIEVFTDAAQADEMLYATFTLE